MTNLFEAMKQLSDEQVREQLALFEVFTVTNVYKDAGYKVAKRLVKATHVVTGLMKRQPLQEPEGFALDEAIQQRKLAREEHPRERLELELKGLLADRCGLVGDVSEEVLSVAIINEAAEIYNLKEELLLSQKADWITKYYRAEKEPVKMVKYLLVQFIATSVEAYGKPFTVKDADLPSYIESQGKKDLIQAHQKLSQRHEKNTAAYDVAIQKLFENNQRIAAKNKFIEEEEHHQESLQEAIKKLQEKVAKEVAEKEIAMKNTQINSYERMLKMSKEEVKSAELYRERWKKDNESLTKEVEKALIEKEATTREVQEASEARLKERETKWEEVYHDFSFEPECLEVMKRLGSEGEVRDCERVLMELHQMVDKKAMGWREIDDYLDEKYKRLLASKPLQYFLFSFNNNDVGILIYEVAEEPSQKVKIIHLETVEEA
ncbi:MAG: hypothetical protein ACRDDX_02815 [Cellulosilyticaceae bacterium]